LERRDEIERELTEIDARVEEIETRLHGLVPPPALASGQLVVEAYAGEPDERKHGEWNELVAEQVLLINQRWRLYAEFSALIKT